MKFKIIHKTEYEFSQAVFFEPHSFRFKPKNTPHLRLEYFKLFLSPKPVGLSEILDPENNFIHFSWFEGLFEKMEINVELIVDSKEYNPFNFLLYPSNCLTTPFDYPDSLKKILLPSLKQVKIKSELRQFGEKILKKTQFKTMDFLTNLTQEIHQAFIVQYRETGEPMNPDETFRLKCASCRDLAWMQIHLLRNLNFATRFVSGYYYIPVEKDTKSQFELHAWLEVYLPGAGWIGFDPSHGIVVANNHFIVSSSPDYENTMSVSGTIRGSASSKMKTQLNIEILS